jgi:hypothetical protein
MSWWDVYTYENEADKYINLERKRRQDLLGTKGLGLAASEEAYNEAYTPMEENKPEFGLEDFTDEQQYRYNRSKFFKGLKEPSFGKIERVSTIKPKASFGQQLALMGAMPLTQPMKVYKFKTIDQETGAEVITNQKEIEVLAENEHNYYYLTKAGIQSVAKNETSMQKLDEKQLKQRFMKQINESSKKMARLYGGSNAQFKAAPDTTLMEDIEAGFGEAGNILKSFGVGFADVLTSPIKWISDKMVEEEDGYLQEFNQDMNIKLPIGASEAQVKKAFAKRDAALKKAKKGNYPKGFSAETDAMAAGKSKEEIAAARELDKKHTINIMLGRDKDTEISTGETIGNIAGEVIGNIATMVTTGVLGKAASAPAKAKWAKALIDAVVTGGGMGILEKIKEKDAEAIDYVRSMAENTLFFGAGAKASKTVGKALGETVGRGFKAGAKRVGKQMLKGGSFGAAGNLSSSLVSEEENTPGKFAIDTVSGMMLDAVMSAVTGGKGGKLNKTALKKLKISEKSLKLKGAKTIAPAEVKVTDRVSFDRKYGLDTKLKGKDKDKVANEKMKNIINDVGDVVIKKAGSENPKAIMTYYKKKYDLKGKLQVEKTLQGDNEFARIEYKTNVKGNKIVVKVNPDKTPKEQAAALRHEIEHLIDLKAGFKPTTTGKRLGSAKTLRDYMSSPGHHEKYKNFEIEYLEKAYLDETIPKTLKATETKAVSDIDNRIKALEEVASTPGISETDRQSVQATIKSLKARQSVPAKSLSALPAENTIYQQSINNRITNIQKTLKNPNLSSGEKKTLNESLIRLQREQATRIRMSQPETSSIQDMDITIADPRISRATNLPVYETPKKTLNDKLNEAVEFAYSSFINRQYHVDKLGNKVKMTSQNYSKYHGQVEYITTQKLVGKDGKEIGKGLADTIVTKNSRTQAEFESYLYHKSHIKRMYQGKPLLMGENGEPIPVAEAKEIVAKYEQAFPEFKKRSKDVYQFFDDMLSEYGLDGDLISKKEYKAMRFTNPEFVPSYRDIESGGVLEGPVKITGGSKGVQRAKGGRETILPLMQSAPLYVKKLVSAYKRNRLHQEILEAVLNNPEKMRKYVEVVDTKKARKSVLEAVKAFGKENENVSPDEVMNRLDNMLISDSKTKGNYMITLLKGEPVIMKVNDKNLFKTLNKMQRFEMTNEKQILQFFNKYVTNTFKGVITTYNPLFAIRNIARDVPTAYIQGSIHNPVKFVSSMVNSSFDILRGNELYKQFVALGGKSANITKIEHALINPENKTLRAKMKNFVSKSLDTLNILGSLSETLPRYNEFKYTYKKGLKEGKAVRDVLEEAIYNSGEVTVNFSRGGSFTKIADTFIPYLNAGTQGVDRWARSLISEGIAKGNFKPLIKSLGIITIPTLAVQTFNKLYDDEAYSKVPDFIKDHNYVLPVGDGAYIKIPKTREAGFLFSTMFEKIVDYIDGDKQAFNSLPDAFKRSMFNPVSELGTTDIRQPVMNIAAGGNKDYFGNNIEPMSAKLSGVSKRYITKDDTSYISKTFAPALESMGLSPAQADYLIKSYTGVIGEFLMSFNDRAAQDKSGQLLKLTHFYTKPVADEDKADYEAQQEAKQNVADFEAERGITDLRKQLKEQGFSRSDIDYEVEKSLGPEYDYYLSLKDKRKELSDD